jgi:RNA polymerase sigma-70 factor (ECF subfamily)
VNDGSTGAAVAPAAADDILALVAREVRPRFSVSHENFAARVAEIVAENSQDHRPVPERAARLCLDDLYLAMACVLKEDEAWRELGTRHFDFMRQFARRFLPEAGARDVVDEVIADLWTRGRLRQYEGRSTLRTWLATVVSHAALNARKAATRREQLVGEQFRSRIEPGDPRLAASDPAHAQAAGVMRDILVDAVRELPTEDRLLLQLYYEQELTLDQMVPILGASGAALSRRLKRTRETLRAQVDHLARQRTGESAHGLRVGIEWSELDVDLGSLLRNPPPASGKDASIV